MTWSWDGDPERALEAGIEGLMVGLAWSPARVRRAVERAIREWDDGPEAGPLSLEGLVKPDLASDGHDRWCTLGDPDDCPHPIHRPGARA